MKTRNFWIKVTAIILVIATFFAVSSSSFACSNYLDNKKLEAEDTRISTADRIVEIARAEIGFFEGEDINKFTTWYYGIDTAAYWCSIFVSWCADQAGVLGTAIPKRALCDSMRTWFMRKGQYYPASSNYVPQKGDIVFLNTAADGTDNVHHVEIVTESGFIERGNALYVKCIGGNTSNLQYEGCEYVTEKVRPVKSERAEIVGYCHPEYEKQGSVMSKAIAFSDDIRLPYVTYIYAMLREFFAKLEYLWIDTALYQNVMSPYYIELAQRNEIKRAENAVELQQIREKQTEQITEPTETTEALTEPVDSTEVSTQPAA